jgi:hypothetical protein
VPGHGGKPIGLGQTVGQCGPTKPSVKVPTQGLFFVGSDAGGTGAGTQQAIEAGMNVADAVFEYHHKPNTHPPKYRVSVIAEGTRRAPTIACTTSSLRTRSTWANRRPAVRTVANKLRTISKTGI